MNDRKLTTKRLIIFLAFSYIPLIIMGAMLYLIYRAPVFVSDEFSSAASITGLGMLFPAAANIITRLITKEGMKNSYLEPNFEKSPKTYFFSVFYKPAEAIAVMLIAAAIIAPELSFSQKLTLGEGGSNIAGVLFGLAFSIGFFFPAFGEEFGWRAYMMPKLTELMGKKKAVIAGGVIWGLWHAPLTVLGHNFGVGYLGFPFTGIFIMCIYCTLMNAVLTFVTEKTRSVYPAAFLHMINNNLSAGAFISTFATEELGEHISNAYNDVNFTLWATMLPFVALSGIICFVLYLKEDKKRISE